MQQQPPTRGIDDQGIIPNPEGVWCYRCIICRDVFTSSQGLAGHQHKHKSEGTWIRGRFYHLRPRNQEVYGPLRRPGRPRAVLYEPQQTMVLQVAPNVEGAPIAPLLFQDQNLFANHPNQLVENTYIDDKEELDLELRL
ncbi:hypothetical protein KY290_001277 [Solanum tuberosum]|uniref:C2H2-type domain-containing protein n=1 Tax=Solanum tuberosum TaxID=4113 RepID=A0ABQ7WNS0_SOLTU|nr:hypothetical protein KY290_001277 [Solanum tuberosum]